MQHRSRLLIPRPAQPSRRGAGSFNRSLNGGIRSVMRKKFHHVSCDRKHLEYETPQSHHFATVPECAPLSGGRIESILAQSVSDWEAIVLDSNSDDGSWE